MMQVKEPIKKQGLALKRFKRDKEYYKLKYNHQVSKQAFLAKMVGTQAMDEFAEFWRSAYNPSTLASARQNLITWFLKEKSVFPYLG